jgi:hypothetical protein
MFQLDRSIIFVFICCVISTNATISQNFYRHIEEKYGLETARLIARTDFGQSGSYGGGTHNAGEKTRLAFKIKFEYKFSHNPVIFVHGMTTKASSTLLMASTFKSHGYNHSELYATTYGTPIENGFPLQIAMRCVHIKGVSF